MSDMFLGTSQEATEFYRSKGKKPPGITITKKEENQKGRRQSSPEDKLDPEKLEPMSEEELYNLKRVRLRHESDTVYMQSDVGFYDYFYREGDTADPLTIAAHQLKRVYMNAEDYFYALDVRDAYIQALIDDKFGGNEFKFNCAMNEGELYVPPVPFYSKRAKDYELVSKGIYMMPVEGESEEEMKRKAVEFVEEWWELRPEMSPKDVVFFEDALTDYQLIKELSKTDSGGLRSSQTGQLVMSVSDIRKVEETLSSIYRGRQAPKTENERLFSRTPAHYKKLYDQSFKMPVSEMLHKYLNGEVDEDAVDLNAMVYDPETNRSMTYGELRKRQLVRQLSMLGWDKLPLMKALNVGSAFERRKMNESLANKRKLKKGMARQLEEQARYSTVTYDHVGIKESDFDPVAELEKYFGLKD